MARIELKGVGHKYAEDGPWAVEPLDLVFEDGGAYALLGPSGCGKTTLLKIVSGLLRPSAGRVIVGGVDVTERPPQERNIAQVFQFPVVYDTMTVEENLAFPLRNRGVPPEEVRSRVREVAALLELEGDLARRATALSADLKQRVSLGRGLVRTDVAAILLDEPLTVIDPHQRWVLRRKLLEVHRRIGRTLVYVTHDQSDALTLADRVVVMNEGRVMQEGTPAELFEDPADPFVGRFIGSPGMNLLPCRVEGGRARIDDWTVPLDAALAARAATSGAVLTLGIRPEYVRLESPGTEGAVDATIASIEHLGRHRVVTTRRGERAILLRVPEETRLTQGAQVGLAFPTERIRIFRAGASIR